MVAPFVLCHRQEPSRLSTMSTTKQTAQLTIKKAAATKSAPAHPTWVDMIKVSYVCKLYVASLTVLYRPSLESSLLCAHKLAGNRANHVFVRGISPPCRCYLARHLRVRWCFAFLSVTLVVCRCIITMLVTSCRNVFPPTPKMLASESHALKSRSTWRIVPPSPMTHPSNLDTSKKRTSSRLELLRPLSSLKLLPPVLGREYLFFLKVCHRHSFSEAL